MKKLKFIFVFLTAFLIACGDDSSSSSDKSNSKENTSDSQNEKEDENQMDKTTNTGSELKKILPLGDSITQGDPASYRYELFQILTKNNYKFDFVGSWKHNPIPATYTGEWDTDGEGHSGWTTEQILEKLPESNWLGAYTADIALIHLGTNDVFQFENVDGISASDRNIRQIIELLRKDNEKISIFLAKILPITSNYKHAEEDGPIKPWNDWVNKWNEQLEKTAAELSTSKSPITMVDMNTGFANADLPDGIHPNVSAAKKMAERWAKALGIEAP